MEAILADPEDEGIDTSDIPEATEEWFQKAKLRMPPGEFDRILDAMVTRLTEQGKLIEAGWISFRLMVVEPNAPSDHMTVFRYAFLGGAQHVFGCLMGALEGGGDDEETDEKVASLLESLNAELKGFCEEIDRSIRRH
jgi:hypothetical protein